MRLILLLLAAGSLFGEERAQISGMVRDASEGALLDATITAVNEDTGIRRSCRSDAAGEYAIASLPAGTYKLTVRKAGFQTIARLNVRLNPADAPRVDFTMQVGSVREVVTIESAPPLTNSEDASVGDFARRQLFDALPLNGRGVLSVIALSPGVVTTPATQGEAGQFTANGQRPNANYFTVDGVSANTGVSGSVTPAQFSGSTLPSMTAFGGTQTLSSTEAIEEVRVQTSGFAPEFGRAPGASIGVSTRSGSNEIHGSAFHGFRNEALNANDWFANASGLGRAASRLNNWGAAIGGPLRRDRTFYFANYEGLRLQQPFTWRGSVPSLASRADAPVALSPLLKAFPAPNGPALGPGLALFAADGARASALDLGALRIDHALTSRISLFGRFQRAPSDTESGFAQVDHSHFNTGVVTVGVSALASPSVTSDLRINATRSNVFSRWTSSAAGGAMPVDLTAILPKPPAQGAVLYGFALGGVGQILSGEGSSSRQNQWNMVETLAWNRGAHALRLGVDYSRLTPSRDHIASSVAGAYAALSDLLAGRPMQISSSVADQASSLIESLSWFAQDTWRLTPNLTATYGLRWELTPAPSYRFANLSAPSLLSTAPVPPGAGVGPFLPSAPPSALLWPTRYSQFAPRIGIAYRLTPATVLRAGWGIFYDVNFAVATDPINAFPYNRWQFASAPPGSAPLLAAYSGNRFTPDLKLPYAHEWNVSFERSLGGTNVVTASYVGSIGRRLLRREALVQSEFPLAPMPAATNDGRANFHGLELQYRRKLSSGLQGLASYAWSHSIDNGSWDSGIYAPLSVDGNRGSSAFDARHNFSAGMGWEMPGFARRWTLSAIVSARSGFPVNILASENLLGLGFDDFQRPNLVPGVPLWIDDPASPGGRRINASAFATPGRRDTQGNLGRNSLTGFGLAQADLALGREFTVRQEGTVSLRLEAINVMNHAQFGDPVRYLTSPLFGQSASMLNVMLGSGTPHSGITPAFQPGGPRVVQVTIRMRF